MKESGRKRNAQRPNIVIVMTDQHRADLRAGAGYPLDTMPFLDRWAGEGIDFRRAYTPNPCCLPARVSMFTGRYPSCHAVRTNHNVADAFHGEDLLDVLKKCGYRTALCGKNHTYLKESDFDFCEATGHLGGTPGPESSPEEIEFAEFLNRTRHMETHIPSPGGLQVQHPYKNVSSALKFIDEERGDAPFFLWLSFAEPHNPSQVPEPYFDMFPPDSLPPLTATAADLPAKGPIYEWERRGWETVMGEETEKRILRTRSNYHGMLRLIDDQFRRFIEGLDKRGLRDDTVIVFLSDHGDYAGEYGLIRKGVGLPEVLTRVTMAWQGPGFVRRVVDDHSCVNLVDILPTICDLLGVEIPFGSQGKSILPLLRGEPYPQGEYDVAYSECGYGGLYWNDDDFLTPKEDKTISEDGKIFVCMGSWTQSGQMRMARKGDYKIEMDMMGTGYLYDLKNDPAEIHNLWDDESYIKVKADMLACLSAAILRADDPIPAPHYRYRTKLHPKGFWFDKDYQAEDPGVRMETVRDYAAGKAGREDQKKEESRRLHRISELNTREYPPDSAAGEERESSLAFNARESFLLDGYESGWYPRVKRLRDGSFIMFYQDRPRMNEYCCRSADGVRWERPVKLFAQRPVEIDGTADERGYMSPDACQLSDGRIICVSSYRVNHHYRSAIGENGVVARFSEDNGETWGDEQTVYVGTNWEPYVMEAENGEIYVFVTVTAPSIYEIGVGNFEYRSSGVALLRSADGGKSWEPRVSGPPYIPQYVMRQYIYTAENGIDRYNDQMPVALRLHDGTIALTAETWHADKNEYWFSICYNRDGFQEDLGMKKSGPASRRGDLFRACAPYTAQFDSGEVVVVDNDKNTFYYRLGDCRAEDFYSPHVVFAESGVFGSVEKASSHSAIMVIETKDYAICGKRAYLNHRLYAARMTPSLTGDTTEWDGNTDALFCGGLTQAQASVRVAHDDENVYILVERLDDFITDRDAVIIYLDDGARGRYAFTLDCRGIAAISYNEPGWNVPLQAADLNGVRAAVQTVAAGEETDAGVIYELAVPKALLHVSGCVRLMFDLVNADEESGPVVVERMKEDASLDEKDGWFTAEWRT